MERVKAIGGVFFKARDPERLSAWYRDLLGIPTEGGHAEFVWRQHQHPDQVGRTVWSVFPAESDYFGAGSSQFMVNYRVDNLERMLEQLRGAGIIVEKVEDYEYGRFAWITDPEGNRLELWEPKGP
jgi:predicted enzyme related to lactoylglutathione lyase